MSESNKKWWQTRPWSEQSRGQKTSMIIGWCVLAILILAVISDKEPTATVASSRVGPAQTAATAQTKPEQVVPTATADKPNTQEPKKPLDLASARQFAKDTLRIINEAEQSLNDGIQLGDVAGIAKQVRRPLQIELERWSTLERPQNDQREHFAYCHDAAMRLQALSYTVQHERTIESMKYLRKDEVEYRKAKMQCEQQVKATDSQIAATIAAEDAELKRKFGGRDCLTVYDVDKQTGQVAEQPKPDHCKKFPPL